MADLETLQTRLTEAEAALHSLNTGVQVVEVWRDGRRVKFNAGDASKLTAYIDDLRCQIAALDSATTGALPRRRFISVAMG